ncbi:MAG TPA: alpha/beta fold hydrolase [Dehalococcoidia bacterium]|nr:alpha/beta fold hydrolase [Dehalococcoidia bacterium]
MVTEPLTGAAIEQRDFLIESGDPGIQLHLREKKPAGVDRFSADRVVLCVHGASHPATTVYDFQFGGRPSWLDTLAGRGFAAYALDIRGYGGSTRLPAMAVPPGENPPFARAEEAIRDIGAAVDHLRQRWGVDRVSLIGFSWGTLTTGMYTSLRGHTVRRLVLYGAAYALKQARWQDLADPDDPTRPRADLGAYRVETRQGTIDRWDEDLAGARDRERVRPPAVLEAYLDQLQATDAESGRLGGIRAPNGVLVDMFYRRTGHPLYDAGRIEVPVLIVRGELDKLTSDTDAQRLFAALTSAPVKRYVVIGQGSHWLAVEANRFQLYHQAQLFLEEDFD